MYLDSVLTNIIAEVAAVEDFKRVAYGMELPDDMNEQLVANTPCVFFWGGKAEFAMTEQQSMTNHVTVERSISAYLYYYDDNLDQATALNAFDALRDKLLLAILNGSYVKYVDVSSIEEDRTTTFMNVGAFFNTLPPMYCTKIDITLRDEQSSF